MNKLYWKIFVSFWCVTMVTFFAAVWLTTEVIKESFISNPEKIQISVDASAAVMLYDAGAQSALAQWLKHLSTVRRGEVYLLNSQGQSVLAQKLVPDAALMAAALQQNKVPEESFRKDGAIVSAPVRSKKGTYYRLLEVTRVPVLLFFDNHAEDLLLRVIFSMLVSGFLCYGISRYLTKPLRKISEAAKNLGEGKLETRVDQSVLQRKDEMAELAKEFDHMAERVENLVSSQQRLLWGVSHELRSPLARMQIALGLVQKKVGDLAQTELARIELESERLNDLIGNLLSLAKLEARADAMARVSMNLTHLVRGVVSDANFEAKAESPRIVFQPGKPLFYQGNESLLHSAVENIVRNALRYSDEAHLVEVSLTLTYTPAAGALITVADRGPGVPNEKLSKLFDPFYRVDDSRNAHSGGYGLGLAIAKKAIALHEGHIKAKNREGGGLTVELFLPFKKRNGLL